MDIKSEKKKKKIKKFDTNRFEKYQKNKEHNLKINEQKKKEKEKPKTARKR